MITNHSHDMLMIRIMMMNQDNYLKGLWIVFPRVSSTASLETESRPSSTSRFDFNYHKHHDCLCHYCHQRLYLVSFQLGCYIGLTGYLWKDKSENGVRRILEEGVRVFCMFITIIIK